MDRVRDRADVADVETGVGRALDPAPSSRRRRRRRSRRCPFSRSGRGRRAGPGRSVAMPGTPGKLCCMMTSRVGPAPSTESRYSRRSAADAGGARYCVGVLKLPERGPNVRPGRGRRCGRSCMRAVDGPGAGGRGAASTCSGVSGASCSSAGDSAWTAWRTALAPGRRPSAGRRRVGFGPPQTPVEHLEQARAPRADGIRAGSSAEGAEQHDEPVDLVECCHGGRARAARRYLSGPLGAPRSASRSSSSAVDRGLVDVDAACVLVRASTQSALPPCSKYSLCRGVAPGLAHASSVPAR